MQYEAITFDITDKVATIVLNRPEAKNALDGRMREEIADVVGQLRKGEDTKDLDVRALIIRGAGGSFCAGGDVKNMGTRRTPAMIRNRIVDAHSWFYDLVNLEMPVIAAVDGPAFGAGFSLSLAADFILATPRSRFCSVFARIGLLPDLAAIFLLPRMVGLQRAKEIIYSTRTLDPEEAKSIGLVYEVVPEGEIEAAAQQLAAQFRTASMTAIGLSKVMLNRSFETDQRTMVELEALAQAAAVDTDQHREAIDAFLNKQPLAYSGFSKSRWRKDEG